MGLLSLLVLVSVADTCDARRPGVLRAVAGYVGPLGLTWDQAAARVGWADLNHDQRPDPVVYLAGADWCGSGGCTLLVFETMDDVDAQEWGRYRTAAEISMVGRPVHVVSSGGVWSDLVVGTDGGLRVLRFDGETYPRSPADGEPFSGPPPDGLALFSDPR